jgi:hypothetical protein
MNMASELPPNLMFTPKEILSWRDGYIAIGVDGELQKLSVDYRPIGKPMKPFPAPIRNATILKDKLIATWLDSELLLARMASIDLNDEIKEGVERSDLRTRRTIDKAIHPEGALWSHVLDAEPLFLASNDDSFTFVLWRKGIYTMTEDAYETWRSEEPSWKSIAKLPRSEETISIIMKENEVEIWSRGGGMNRYDMENGLLTEQKVIDTEGFLLSVYQDSNNYLFQLNDGQVAMFDGEKIVLKAKLSGPIQTAYWDNENEGWHISGWREIIFISATSSERISIGEIAVYYDDDKKYVLCNDAKWYDLSLKEEE